MYQKRALAANKTLTTFPATAGEGMRNYSTGKAQKRNAALSGGVRPEMLSPGGLTYQVKYTGYYALGF
jgi:hypothetical protein